MLESFYHGIILGLGVAVPFGPMNVLILSYALRSFKNAFALGLGAMSADIIYLALLCFGVLKLLDFPMAKKIIAIFGFVFLTYMAYNMIRSKKSLNIKKDSIKEDNIKNYIKSYFKGLGLNLFNPFIIGFWLSVSLLFSHNASPFMMSLGLFIAILAWIFALSYFVARFARIFTNGVVFCINIISALIIEYFALLLIYTEFKSIF